MLLWIKAGRLNVPAKLAAPFRPIFITGGGGSGTSLPLTLVSLAASGEIETLSAVADAESVSAGVG